MVMEANKLNWFMQLLASGLCIFIFCVNSAWMLMEKAMFCCEMGGKDGMKQWNNHLPFGIWIGKFTTILPCYNFMFIEDNKMILSYFFMWIA